MSEEVKLPAEDYRNIIKERDALRELLETMRIGLSSTSVQLGQLATQLDQAKRDPVAYLELSRRQEQQLKELEKLK